MSKVFLRKIGRTFEKYFHSWSVGENGLIDNSFYVKVGRTFDFLKRNERMKREDPSKRSELGFLALLVQ